MYIKTHIGMLQECKVAPHAPSADDKLSGRSAVENPPMRVPSGHRDRGAADTHIQLKPDLTSLKLQHDAIRIA